MLKMTRRSITLFCCSLALFNASIFADEGEDKTRIKPGTRPLAHTEWLKIQTEREEQEKQYAENPDTAAEDEENEIVTSDCKLQSPFQVSTNFKTPTASVRYTSHSGAFHSPLSVSLLGDTVELEDGSIWAVAAGDTYKTLNWLTSDLLVITPNHTWFSNYLYCMTNQNTGVSVKVNLFLGPIYNGIFTHWIAAINYFTQEICLEDGSIWHLSGFDSAIFNKWLLNDTIIIGVNDGFLSSSKPNILINVNTLTHSRAKCIY